MRELRYPGRYSTRTLVEPMMLWSTADLTHRESTDTVRVADWSFPLPWAVNGGHLAEHAMCLCDALHVREHIHCRTATHSMI